MTRAVEYSALAVAPSSLRVIRPILQHDPAPWVSDHTPSFLDISSIFKAAQYPPKNFFST